MTAENAIVVERACVEDAGEILALQKLAFRSQAKLYGDDRLPPLTQTLAGLEADFASKVILKASLDGRIVGSVRGYEQEETCHVARLVVLPGRENRGIGTLLMHALEDAFAHAGRFELFTGHRSENSLYLYKKLGYREFRRERVSDELTLVYMEKCNN
jgi:ribosomal protein S18 acetylase RimI-like enzyme